MCIAKVIFNISFFVFWIYKSEVILILDVIIGYIHIPCL